MILKEGYSWNVKTVDAHFNGVVTVKDKDKFVCAILSIKNGRLNGICKLFKNGVLYEERKYNNNSPQGISFMIKDFKKVGYLLYNRGNLIQKYFPSELKGYWDVFNAVNDQKVMCCKINEKFEADGKGYLYDNGKIKSVVLFEDGDIVQMIKCIEGNVMAEMNCFGVTVYQGAYSDSLKNDYCREGYGEEFEKGKLVYFGNWKDNKRNGKGESLANGYVNYVGNWKDGYAHGYGMYIENDKIVATGNWNKGILETDSHHYEFFCNTLTTERLSSKYPIEIQRSEELQHILNMKQEEKDRITKLVIKNQSCTTFSEALEINAFTNLRQIDIGFECLLSTPSLTICNNPNLIEINIQNASMIDSKYCSLARVKTVIIESNNSFYIPHEIDLPKLKTFMAGHDSFKNAQRIYFHSTVFIF